MHYMCREIPEREQSRKANFMKAGGSPGPAPPQASGSSRGRCGSARRYSRICRWRVTHQQRAGCRRHIGLTHQALADKEGRHAHALKPGQIMRGRHASSSHFKSMGWDMGR